MMRPLCAAAMLLLPLAAAAESRLPFGREWVGDRELPRPWGVGFDLVTLDQDYEIDALSFTLPGVTLGDTDVIDVTNEVQHADIKADVWLLPFLNVHALLGKLEGDTDVDLSGVSIPNLPIPLGVLPIRYKGTVYGAGFTAVYGGEHWFVSLTGNYADTDVEGDFDSSVRSVTWQPRIGALWQSWAFWVGGFYLDADERHSGTIALPGLGAIPFDVSLGEADKLSYVGGARYRMGEHAEATLELGGGSRQVTVFNLTFRF